MKIRPLRNKRDNVVKRSEAESTLDSFLVKHAEGKASLTYSQPVLQALQAKGFSLASVQRAARASAEFIVAVLDGRREFSDAQILRLEKLSGLTGGQLASSILEPNGGPLTKLSEIWAKAATMNFAKPRRRKPSSESRKVAV